MSGFCPEHPGPFLRATGSKTSGWARSCRRACAASSGTSGWMEASNNASNCSSNRGAEQATTMQSLVIDLVLPLAADSGTWFVLPQYLAAVDTRMELFCRNRRNSFLSRKRAPGPPERVPSRRRGADAFGARSTTTTTRTYKGGNCPRAAEWPTTDVAQSGPGSDAAWLMTDPNRLTR
jgi:hypothetical protein